MNKLANNYKMLLFLYGSFIFAIGSYFLIRDTHVMQQLHYELPLLFLLRFSVFWFMCLMVALAAYLSYLSYNHLGLPHPDKIYAARLGRIALYVGIAGGLLALIFFTVLQYFSIS